MQWQYYPLLELDSAIFEAIVIQEFVPEALVNSSYSPHVSCKDWKDLCHKYYSFIVKPKSEDTPEERNIKGLHAMEMVLAVLDDVRGKEEDILLNIPSFVSYAEERAESSGASPKSEIDNILEGYYKQACESGFPHISAILAGKTLTYSSRLISKRCRSNIAKDSRSFLYPLSSLKMRTSNA